MRYIDPDIPLPSIEPGSYLEPDLTFDEDHPDCELHSAPIFIDDGVLVGFWYADSSGNGKRPVYCSIEEDFQFTYRKGDSFVLTTDYDFDLLDELEWLHEDAEDKDSMSPIAVKAWTEMMWESRECVETQDMIYDC